MKLVNEINSDFDQKQETEPM